MPVAAKCPHCSATMRAPDEAAGRKVKCPKCGGGMQLPEASAPSSPTSAQRAAKSGSAKPRPTDDEPDEQPRKKRVADDDEDEDDRPRSKRRSRRDDEDDRPRQKKSALPLILGILAGAFLLCGGGCAGLYFVLIQPAMEKANEIVKNSGKSSPPGEPAPKPTEATAAKLRLGMSPAEVTAVVGPGSGYQPTAARPVAISVSPDRQRDTLDRWVAKIEAGCVEERLDGQTQLLVAYSHPPPTPAGRWRGSCSPQTTSPRPAPAN